MNVPAQLRIETGRAPRLVPAAPRLRWAVSMTTLAGGALTVLVGLDGSTLWRAARSAATILLTLALVSCELRLSDRGWARLSAAFGALALAVGVGFFPHVIKEGVSPESVGGTIAAVAGLGLLVASVAVGTRGRGVLGRVGTGLATFVTTGLVLFVVGPPVAATNVPRPALGAGPASVGLTYEDVTLTTGDGVDLAAWYVGSTNRSAVILLHGAGSTRSSVLDQAAVLADHGFGVLMVDARGHGRSQGRAMDFGWHGDADIAAAARYLAHRPDVDPERIAAVGLSMGGEEAIGASASNPLIHAVVAEGATARTAADEGWLSQEFGLRGLLQERLESIQDWVTDGLTSAPVPRSLRGAIAGSVRTSYLLITAGDLQDEGYAAAYMAAGAPSRVDVWTVPGAGHTDGLQSAPREWEARVIGFLTEALDPPR